MRIKATINVEYDVDPRNYNLPEECDQEEAIVAIEHNSLHRAIVEVMPWLSIDSNGHMIDNQVLKILVWSK